MNYFIIQNVLINITINSVNKLYQFVSIYFTVINNVDINQRIVIYNL